MTNEEKAIQLSTDSKGNIQSFAHMSAFEMALWKDEQFASIIEDKLNYARKMIKENNGKSVSLKYAGMRKILIEIKNELNAK